ncbi:uncharacterized protein LOC110747052 [Prunus avium]|uniref:Uncharacterized protein LOC110747052 n=1 Tax=Prunus avium TaxID=42229 RepID=A0A6P5RPI6_PRUAV|nr:uncharacterized protein LOC110747052 [Prunus avium]
MSPLTEREEDQFSGSDREEEEEEDDDDDFDEDMEAIRRACMLTGTNPDDLNPNNNNNHGGDEPRHSSGSEAESDSDEVDDDLELLRKIRSRFSNFSDFCEPLSLKPLSSLPPAVSDDEEDDYQTLLSVQKRFAAYQNDTCKPVKETCNEIAHESSQGTEDACMAIHPLSDNAEGQPSASVELQRSDSCRPSTLPAKYSTFPKSAQVFMDAIKKNRSSQKFLRSKLVQLEAKIEENRKLKERVKILKDFQVSCKKRTGEALSQKKDPRVQLILVNRPRKFRDLKAHDKKISAMFYGPEENSHVANYRMTLMKFLHSLDRKKWSKAEKKALEKGIRQQFQEMVLQFSVHESSCSERPYGYSNHIDDILASIKDLEITPEKIREFLPKVNWEQLASMYIVGRSSGECEARWLNWEDPLINHKSWTAKEDKNLLHLVQEKGIDNWFNIAVLLGTNRTPFQCLARYQRSLNASILKQEWTKDEDARLRSAVEALGEGDWQSVASALEGRTGSQCSNRWKKSLHPTRKREGRWTPEEDKRLKVAQMLFGPKNWNKTAQFVPGRTQAQCRDRYVNSLEPSLKWGEWTEEEDSRLREAIAEYGYCWSKVAACVPRRTDNMCWRRWKVLFPDEVSLLKEEKRIRKAALMCNFVDRETERPALGPNDFRPPIVTSTKTLTYSRKQKGKLSKVLKKIRSRRQRNNSQSCSKVSEIDSFDKVETSDGHDASNTKNKVRKQRRIRHKGTEPTGECQVVVTLPCEQDTHKEPREMSCSDQIVGTSDEDDTTLACFLRNKSKKRKLGPVPSINGKKKRKLVASASAVQECPANSIQKGSEVHPEMDKVCDGNQIVSFRKDDEFVVHCDDRISERMPSCSVQSSHLNGNIMASDNEPDGLKLVSGRKAGLQEPVRKVVGIDPESDGDTDGVVLASLRKKKLKKRHPQTAKSSPHACLPSGVTTRSEPLPKTLDQSNDRSQVAFLAVGNEPGAIDIGKQHGVDHCETAREIVNIGAEGDHEAGDTTLACFLRNKSKNSQRQSRRGDNQKPR